MKRKATIQSLRPITTSMGDRLLFRKQRFMIAQPKKLSIPSMTFIKKMANSSHIIKNNSIESLKAQPKNSVRQTIDKTSKLCYDAYGLGEFISTDPN